MSFALDKLLASRFMERLRDKSEPATKRSVASKEPEPGVVLPASAPNPAPSTVAAELPGPSAPATRQPLARKFSIQRIIGTS